jgi:serine/threonine-protein kinase
MPVAESKPLWASAGQRKGAAETPKVLEFPGASDGLAREARLSATEAFMPGAVAPSLPERMPSTPEKHEAVDTPINSPIIVRSSPEMVASATASVASRLDVRPGTNWSEETLRKIEKRLATIVGPLARVLVNRASAQSNNLEELLSALVAKLPSESDRKAFLAAKSEFIASTVVQAGPERSDLGAHSTTLGAVNPDIDPQSLERATHILARYVGPIASILVKRAATRAHGIEELYLSLAERVDENKRAQFLKECGLVG